MISLPRIRSLVRSTALPLLAAGLAHSAGAQVNVWTYHYDNARTGANTSETTLTPANVNPFTFGQIFSQTTDGQVYAQPLYVANVTVPGKGTHNVVYVATMHDSVYAFDADNNTDTNAAPLWKDTFVTGLAGDGTGVIPVPPGPPDVGNGYGDIKIEVGITSTPVIDTSTGTIYCVTKTKEISGPSTNRVTKYVQRLHALSIADGSEKFNGPAVIAASVNGVGYNGAYGAGQDAVGGKVSFDPQNEIQRAGLLLLNGKVYISWAAHEDHDHYHGWVLGYSASDLTQTPDVFCAAPDGGRAGIWHGGAAPAADSSGNIYIVTGNGTVTVPGPSTTGNFGDGVVKLSTTSGLHVSDYFIPMNQSSLDAGDQDLGCSGPMLIPDQPGTTKHTMVATGKQGIVYLMDKDNLGGYSTSADHVIQEVTATANGSGTRGAPAYWNGRVYYASFGAGLKIWPLTGASLATTPASISPDTFGYPGGIPTISANGNTNGIAWIIEVSGATARLRAYDALDVSHELYASDQTNGRDVPGGPIKFTVPMVTNGKVYIPTATGISVFANIVDNTTLTLQGAVSTSTQTVTALFNRPLDSSTGSDPSHYTISQGVQVIGSTVSADGRSATLQTSGLTPGVTYQLSVTGLLDSSTPPHQVADNSTVSFSTTPLSGDGLIGTYFNNKTLTGSPVLTRVDPGVNFDWVDGSPDPVVHTDSFSARWTGYVEPIYTDNYTFYVTADDGSRLFFNNGTTSILPTASWGDQSATEYHNSTAIPLVAGQRYPIKLEYYENGGEASVSLYWSSSQYVAKSPVPQNQLYSTGTVYTLGDVVTALNITGGLAAAADTRLNVETGAGSALVVNLQDGARLLRKVMGVDSNP